MSSIVENIANYLEDQLIGTLGTDLFDSKYPPSPDNCIAVIGRPGLLARSSVDVPELRFSGFQVIVRNRDYTLGEAKLKQVRDALHVKIGLQLDDYFLLRMHAVQEGGYIGQDEQNRYEFSINFQVEAR